MMSFNEMTAKYAVNSRILRQAVGFPRHLRALLGQLTWAAVNPETENAQ